MDNQNTREAGDFLDAFKRRRSLLAFSALGFFTLAILVAVIWPPTYRSAATILIEAQEIPADLVRSTITSFATQRIQVTSQRAMTRANLLSIIDKYELYADRRERETTEEIIGRMRSDIAVEMISADVVDPRSGRPAVAAIAFTLSYEGDQASSTQKVASELVSLYLSENIKTRTEKASETFEFITAEAERVKEQLDRTDSKLADFKEKYRESLPSLNSMNMQLLQRSETDLRQAEAELTQLQDRAFYLQGQLQTMQPFGSVDSTADAREIYLQLAARYSSDHPDVIAAKKRLEALENESGTAGRLQSDLALVDRLRDQLATLKKTYSDSHPDVIASQRQLDEALAEVEKNKDRVVETQVGERVPENPLYKGTKDQLVATQSSIAAKQLVIRKTREKMADLEQRLLKSPQVEREFLSLLRERQHLEQRHTAWRAKQMTAEVAKELEAESKGERFILIDPPQLPEQPEKPDRPFILILGFLLAIGGGIGVTGIAQVMDKAVYGARGVAAAFQTAPLAVIPIWKNDEDLRKHRKKILLFWGVVAGLFVAALLVVHFFYSPLDVLWFRALRKADRMTSF